MRGAPHSIGRKIQVRLGKESREGKLVRGQDLSCPLFVSDAERASHLGKWFLVPNIKIFTVIAALTFSSQAAFADCNAFVAFNEEGNWAEDIHTRVEDALSCEEWPLEFDLRWFTAAQEYIVYRAVSEQRPDEALQIAHSFFDAAVARHERATERLGPAGLFTDEGKFVFHLKTRIGQLEFIAADVESSQHNPISPLVRMKSIRLIFKSSFVEMLGSHTSGTTAVSFNQSAKSNTIAFNGSILVPIKGFFPICFSRHFPSSLVLC